MTNSVNVSPLNLNNLSIDTIGKIIIRIEFLAFIINLTNFKLLQVSFQKFKFSHFAATQ